MKTDILIAGVGGQGTLLASVLLGDIAITEGKEVKLSEVHGMAQRGGSVVTHVRISDGPIASPVIDNGQADILLSFEMLEALRSLPFLKKDGMIFVNEQKIMPMPVIKGARSYPEDIRERLEQGTKNIKYIDAASLAREAGNMRTINTVMLGALSGSMDTPVDTWLKAIEKCVKPAFVDVNKKAFMLGRNI